MKPSIRLNVELGGTITITQAITEAKELCMKLNVGYICFTFNNVKVSVSQEADIEAAVESYRKCCTSGYMVVA